MNTPKQKKATVRIGLPQRPNSLSGKDTIRIQLPPAQPMNTQTQQQAPITQRTPPVEETQKVPLPPAASKPATPAAVQQIVDGAQPAPSPQQPPVAPPIETALQNQTAAAPPPVAVGSKSFVTPVAAPPAGAPPVAAPPAGAPPVAAPPAGAPAALQTTIPHPLPPDQGVGTSPHAPAPLPSEEKKSPTQAILVGAAENREELAEDLAVRLHALTRKSQWVDFGLAFVALLVSVTLLIVLMRI